MATPRPAVMVAQILEGYRLPDRGMHGVLHWGRVHENGRLLAERLRADAEIVALFALFHDARRVNENRDPGHGLRGGELARSLRGTLIHPDDRRFELLQEACRLHTDGLTTGDLTLQACWDADRLDLGRVGIRPDPRFLCSDAARQLCLLHTAAPSRTGSRPSWRKSGECRQRCARKKARVPRQGSCRRVAWQPCLAQACPAPWERLSRHSAAIPHRYSL
ncbi:MAG TPA: hypothetical protein VMG41_12810 [Gemmatimonadales bacterium]|nr:hypothetical protein [Gemmatimonadales bacterium]